LIREESVVRFEAIQESIIPASTEAPAPAGTEKKKGGSQPRVRKAGAKAKASGSDEVKAASKPARSKKDSSKTSGKRKSKDEKKSK
jgi:hypothetical protein